MENLFTFSLSVAAFEAWCAGRGDGGEIAVLGLALEFERTLHWRADRTGTTEWAIQTRVPQTTWRPCLRATHQEGRDTVRVELDSPRVIRFPELRRL